LYHFTKRFLKNNKGGEGIRLFPVYCANFNKSTGKPKARGVDASFNHELRMMDAKEVKGRKGVIVFFEMG